MKPHLMRIAHTNLQASNLQIVFDQHALLWPSIGEELSCGAWPQLGARDARAIPGSWNARLSHLRGHALPGPCPLNYIV